MVQCFHNAKGMLITSSDPDTTSTWTVVDLYAMQMHLSEKTRHTKLTDIS